MSVSLLLPAAGQSARYPDHDPKWLLKMPSGLMMLEESVSQIRTSSYDRVIVVLLKDHVENYFTFNDLKNRLRETIDERLEIVVLDNPTSCQAETVVKAIEKLDLSGGIWIKDCDNTFHIDFAGQQNSVATVNLHNMNMVDAKSKSYITIDDSGLISNIVEKQIISNDFCCGGYGFESCDDFIRVANNLLSDSKDVFISHVILQMLLDGVKFVPLSADRYFDWGTQKEYQDWQRCHQTIVCNFEGCLIEVSNNSWSDTEFQPILQNLQTLSEISQSDNTYLILLSGYSEEMREKIADFLADYEVKVDQILLGAPHSRQILLSTFSRDNIFPSAIAVNLQQNSPELGAVLKSSIRS